MFGISYHFGSIFYIYVYIFNVFSVAIKSHNSITRISAIKIIILDTSDPSSTSHGWHILSNRKTN